MTMIYVVTMYANYDQGCGGVFSTREAAEEHAHALAADSDGHHDFRINEYPLNHPIYVEKRWYRNTKKEQTRTPKVTFLPFPPPFP